MWNSQFDRKISSEEKLDHKESNIEVKNDGYYQVSLPLEVDHMQPDEPVSLRVQMMDITR